MVLKMVENDVYLFHDTGRMLTRIQESNLTKILTSKVRRIQIDYCKRKTQNISVSQHIFARIWMDSCKLRWNSPHVTMRSFQANLAVEVLYSYITRWLGNGLPQTNSTNMIVHIAKIGKAAEINLFMSKEITVTNKLTTFNRRSEAGSEVSYNII